MWYLIVPPIVIVVCIAFLLWYLSRKAADPRVSERVQELSSEPAPVHFSGIKEFFLRLLEKFAQRSKTRSLRMHNAMHNWLQSIRASRKKVSESRTAEHASDALGTQAGYESEITRAQTPESDSQSFFEAVEEPVARVKESHNPLSALEMPIRRRMRERKEVVAAPMQAVPQERTERPMVSEHMARPESALQAEGRRRRTLKAASPEEGLIGQIATNPKDFAAYEALGDYYMESGNIKDAKECYRQVLKLSPVHRMVKIKIRRLEKILSQKA